MTEQPTIALRLPRRYAPKPVDWAPPINQWLEGAWWVTHSSRPRWRTARNVTRNYTALAPDARGVPRLQDVTSYQPQEPPDASAREVHGVDKPAPRQPAAWDWRGRGRAWMAGGARWEVLGWGSCAGDDNQWAVIYMGPTHCSPAAVDVYARQKQGLPAEVTATILTALRAWEEEDLKALVEKLFEVPRD